MPEDKKIKPEIKQISGKGKIHLYKLLGVIPSEPEPCRPGCQMVDEGMGGPPVHHHQNGCPNGPWTQFIRGQVRAAAVPPEPAPPTPSADVKGAVARLWSAYGLASAARGELRLVFALLGETPPDEDDATSTPAAPPTVALARPAREVAHWFVMETARCDTHAPACPACMRWENAVTALLERDRASRSPGVLDAATVESARVILQEVADGNGGHLGYSDEETCTCVRCRAKNWFRALAAPPGQTKGPR